MRLEVLGCSGGFGSGLPTTAFRVDHDVLIDAGTGVGALGPEAMHEIRHVFVTHSHIDHVVGIPLLVDALFNVLDEPLTVHARQATIDALREHIFNDVVWPDFTRLPDAEHPVLQFRALEPGECCRIRARTFESIDVVHAVPAAAYLCSDPNAAFCFTGDTTTNDTLWTALNRTPRLDLLIVETAFPNRERALADAARHYCPRLLASDLAELRHRPRILVSHLKPGEEEEVMAELAAAMPDRELDRLQAGETFTL